MELFIISLHWLNCWMTQSLVLQEVWKKQYNIFQKLCMKSWTQFRSVVCSGVYVAPDIILRNLWLLTLLLQIFSLHGRLFSMLSFVTGSSLQLVGRVNRETGTTFSESSIYPWKVLVHLSSHGSIHLGKSFALPILLAEKVAKPSSLNIFQLIPWWNGTYCMSA